MQFFKVLEVRLRFIAILVVTGLAIGYWDALANRWERWTRKPTPGPAVTAQTEYFCPMHPRIVRAAADPGGVTPKCPVCGMSLSIRPKGQRAPLPAGVLARVQLSPERIQLAGIRTVPVAVKPLVRELRTLGNVTYDEARVTVVPSRTAGYLEKLAVSRTYETVTTGQPLVEIFSPELEGTVAELLLASHGALANLGPAVRHKLILLGLTPGDVDEIQRTGHPVNRVTLRSPIAGHVIRKPSQPGARVEAGAPLFEIADLSVVWVEAAVYEKDLPFVSEGQPVQVTLEALPGEAFPGRIALVHPHVDAATRTGMLRIVLANPAHRLRPGMAATVAIRTALDQLPAWRGKPLLAVPEVAVIDTGARRVVYVESSPGVYDGRAVTLGPRAGDDYPVIDGLTAGERVVERGAFLVDAETRLNPAAAGTYSGGGAPGGRP